MNSIKTLLIAFLLLVAAGISSNLLAQQKKVHVKVKSNGTSTDSVYTVTYSSDSKDRGEKNIVSVRHSNKNRPGDSILEIEVNNSDNEEESNEDNNQMVMTFRSSGDDAEEMEEANEEFPVIYTMQAMDCNGKCCDNDSCMKQHMRKRIVMHMNHDMYRVPGPHKMRYVMRRNGEPVGDVEREMEMIPMHASQDTTITHISAKGDTIKIHRKVLKDGKVQQEVMVNRHSEDSTENQFYTFRDRPRRNQMMFRKMRTPKSDEDFEFMMPPMPPSAPGFEDMNFNFPGMPEGIDENADFGKIKVTPVMGKNLIRISLDLSGKENTTIRINDEKGKPVFEEKIKDLTGKYVRDIDMTGNQKGKYSLGVERGKSNLTRQFTY